MQYRVVPKNGDQLSVLGFGCMRLPQKGINLEVNIDKAKAKSLIYEAIDQGVNYFDTGYLYHGGQSEPFLGEILTHGLRNKVKIATKLPPHSVNVKADLQKILDNQLKKLQTDHIDYYLLHGLDKYGWNKLTKLDVLDFLAKQQRDGKIINPGFSFHGTEDLFQPIVDSYPWSFCQIQYNILDINFQAGTKGLKYAASKGLAVMVMGPFRGGTLVNNIPHEIMKLWRQLGVQRTPAQWALKWLYDHEEVTVVLSGMNDESQLEENLKTASESLAHSMSEAEKKLIDAIRNKYQELLEIPCTGCRYCVPCQQDVDIPRCFDLYNRVKFFKDNKLKNRFAYMMDCNGLEKGKATYASKCVGCGKCMKVCPQKIDIPAKLKKVEREFEGLPLKGLEIVAGILYGRANKK